MASFAVTEIARAAGWRPMRTPMRVSASRQMKTTGAQPTPRSIRAAKTMLTANAPAPDHIVTLSEYEV